MKLIIDIPESTLIMLKESGVDWLDAEHILSAVAEGVPVSERKKGEWLQLDDVRINNSAKWVRYCSICGHRASNFGQDNFCSKCGADMRGKQ